MCVEKLGKTRRFKGCLVPRRLSLDEHVRAKEGGKDKDAPCSQMV